MALTLAFGRTSGQASALPQGAPASADVGGVVVLIGALESYRSAGRMLASELKGRGIRSLVLELKSPSTEVEDASIKSSIEAFKPAAMATSGPLATQWARRVMPGVPLVFFMSPNILDEPGQGQPVATPGITSDVPPRQIAQDVRRWAPQVKSVAIPSSPATRRTVESLVAALHVEGIEATPVESDKDRFLDALKLIEDSHCQAVLMILDVNVYTAANIKSLLLWGARNRIPVWGFSENVVKAGAFAGVYYDEQRIAAQTAQLLVRVLSGNAPSNPGFEYASGLKRSINLHTSQVIGLPVDGTKLEPDVTRFGDSP